MQINKAKIVTVKKILYSNNDRSDVIPARIALYKHVRIFVMD